MNAFDFVVTVALGSTLATILLSRDVSLAQGALALALLIVLQFVITWTSVRVAWVKRLVTGDPVLLLHDGRMLHKALRSARVTEDEVRAAVRAAGVASTDDVKAVVLETDGSFSVIGSSDAPASSLAGVEGADVQACARDASRSGASGSARSGASGSARSGASQRTSDEV